MTNKFPFTIRQIAEILQLKIRYAHPDNGNLDVDCPFCKAKSKMNLNAAKNVYRCNSCGEYGGMVQLYGKLHGVSNTDAFREICEILGCSGIKSANESTATLEQKESPIVRANNDTIHQTYSMLLSMLTLAAPHREQLLARGLSQEQIERFNYKSVPAFGQQKLCARLLQSGCTLEGVPGFYRENDEWSIKPKASGVLIPICGIDGKIAGMQIRLNKPVNERKYIWFSSTGIDGGASSGTPIHFAGDPTAKRIYVTDGALKGTVAHALTGYTFVCIPGAKCLSEIDGLLSCLKSNGTVEAVEAFNMTKLTNKQVGESAVILRERLSALGIKVKSAVWSDTSLNGIDDYYLHRMKASKNHIYSVDITEKIAV
ncbi:MAG: CHC2 zinc finger domain-containing protein [Defluviitaleaceae bacterium]|nr:CHC2 zinc finger domain-containing protein [Defluviitaleaceae bacterium]